MTLVIHEAHKRRINIGVRSGVIKMNRKTKLTWTTEKEFIVVLEKKKKKRKSGNTFHEEYEIRKIYQSFHKS